MSIRRYEHSSGTLRLHREGTLVSYTDHCAELAAARAERDALNDRYARLAGDYSEEASYLRARAEKAEAEAARLRKALSLIAIVEQGCGGNLTFKEMAESAMSQARAALQEDTSNEQ